MSATPGIPAAEALRLTSLIPYTEGGIASRVIGRSRGGNVTLFSFDARQGLTEHTSPYDALVAVLDGTLLVTVRGTRVRATAGSLVRIPSNAPHSLEAPQRAKMMLILLRGRKT